jgi:hypothetical protein
MQLVLFVIIGVCNATKGICCGRCYHPHVFQKNRISTKKKVPNILLMIQTSNALVQSYFERDLCCAQVVTQVAFAV